ncbi:hypothetical protein [Microbulbifer epialgicus]|uniref:Uncharacterized protein n=1 Tax=Microbulbifer epialgicus TaxID=393907 RepID=A0ABV4P6P9_9GAMM
MNKDAMAINSILNRLEKSQKNKIEELSAGEIEQVSSGLKNETEFPDGPWEGNAYRYSF